MFNNIHKNLSYTPLDFYKNLQFIQSRYEKYYKKHLKNSTGQKEKKKYICRFRTDKKEMFKKFQELFE